MQEGKGATTKVMKNVVKAKKKKKAVRTRTTKKRRKKTKKKKVLSLAPYALAKSTHGATLITLPRVARPAAGERGRGASSDCGGQGEGGAGGRGQSEADGRVGTCERVQLHQTATGAKRQQLDKAGQPQPRGRERSGAQ